MGDTRRVRDHAAERERRRPEKCRRCRRPHGEVYVSFRGLCTECSIAAVAESNRSMAERSGPAYERWKKKMAAYAKRLEEE